MQTGQAACGPPLLTESTAGWVRPSSRSHRDQLMDLQAWCATISLSAMCDSWQVPAPGFWIRVFQWEVFGARGARCAAQRSRPRGSCVTVLIYSPQAERRRRRDAWQPRSECFGRRKQNAAAAERCRLQRVAVVSPLRAEEKLLQPRLHRP